LTFIITVWVSICRLYLHGKIFASWQQTNLCE